MTYRPGAHGDRDRSRPGARGHIAVTLGLLVTPHKSRAIRPASARRRATRRRQPELNLNQGPAGHETVTAAAAALAVEAAAGPLHRLPSEPAAI